MADSVNGEGNRLTTMLLRYPRCVHAEFMTHRVFSRNSASSRAIPVKKLIKDVMDDPYVPIVWGKNQRGMQSEEECDAGVQICHPVDEGPVLGTNRQAWLNARNDAVAWATRFDEAGYHKQIINRLLEPFSHITVVATATEWSNFFALRRHAAAEPHIHALADRAWEAMQGSVPRLLETDQWHLPFVTEQEVREASDWAQTNRPPREGFFGKAAGIEYHDAGVSWHRESKKRLIKLSVARCASTSYKTVDGFDMTPSRAIELHDKLVAAAPMHASPCEHQATPDSAWITPANDKDPYMWIAPELHGNFIGWKQYRKMLVGESQ